MRVRVGEWLKLSTAQRIWILQAVARKRGGRIGSNIA